MELFCSSKYYDGIHRPCLQHSPRAHIKHKQTYKNIILRWAILITDGLRIAHLRIAPQWAILRWAILTVIANVVLELNPILKNALKSCQTSYLFGGETAANYHEP